MHSYQIKVQIVQIKEGIFISQTKYLKNLLKRKPVYGNEFTGKRYDCGSKLGYLQANVAFGLRDAEIGTSFQAWLQNSK